jgi:hypothetical protein
MAAVVSRRRHVVGSCADSVPEADRTPVNRRSCPPQDLSEPVAARYEPDLERPAHKVAHVSFKKETLQEATHYGIP